MPLLELEPLSDRAGYVLAVAATALATGVNALMAPHFGLTNLVMVYLVGVAYVASRCSQRPAVLASVLGVAAFDFCFVPPGGTFAVEDVEYLFTFGVMLLVSLLISTLTVRLRESSRARHTAIASAQVEQMRGDLLSAVSHDLRTPLASIEGSAGALLCQPELTEQSRQLASTIQEEAIRMARLVRDLLDMTRMQGTVDLELDWYALDELAVNAILRTQELFEHPVHLEIDRDLQLVRVDGVLIEQVLVNVLENAARHAGRWARVGVRLSGLKDLVRVEVSDDGPGIVAASERAIFERFVGEKGKGFGLGLAICRAAVEAHGGRIYAENLAPRGAMFTIDLPAEREADVA